MTGLRSSNASLATALLALLSFATSGCGGEMDGTPAPTATPTSAQVDRSAEDWNTAVIRYVQDSGQELTTANCDKLTGAELGPNDPSYGIICDLYFLGGGVVNGRAFFYDSAEDEIIPVDPSIVP